MSESHTIHTSYAFNSMSLTPEPTKRMYFRWWNLLQKKRNSRAGSKDLLRNQQCQYWIKKCEFNGIPDINNFELKTEEIPDLEDRHIRLKALCYGIPAYIILLETAVGTPIPCEQIARVEDTRHPDFHLHAIVVCAIGWRTNATVCPDEVFVRIISQPPLNIPLTLFLGTLGLPGLMLYFSFMEICKPSEGDVVLITGNLMVAELVGTLALKQGCTVIVVVSSESLKDYLRSKFPFHLVVDRRCVRSPRLLLESVAPNGVDIYFDTIGAEVTYHYSFLLKTSTRTCVMGVNQTYIRRIEDYTLDPYHFTSFIGLMPEVHSVFEFKDRFAEAEHNIMALIKPAQFDSDKRDSDKRNSSVGRNKLSAQVSHNTFMRSKFQIPQSVFSKQVESEPRIRGSWDMTNLIMKTDDSEDKKFNFNKKIKLTEGKNEQSTPQEFMLQPRIDYPCTDFMDLPLTIECTLECDRSYQMAVPQINVTRRNNRNVMGVWWSEKLQTYKKTIVRVA